MQEKRRPGRPLKDKRRHIPITVYMDPDVLERLEEQELPSRSEFINAATKSLLRMLPRKDKK